MSNNNVKVIVNGIFFYLPVKKFRYIYSCQVKDLGQSLRLNAKAADTALQKSFWHFAIICRPFITVLFTKCVMCHVSCVMCHMPCVRCHISRVTCRLSPVTCHLSNATCHLSLSPPPAKSPIMYSRMEWKTKIDEKKIWFPPHIFWKFHKRRIKIMNDRLLHIFSPKIKEPNITHALAPSSAFNLKLCLS